VAPTDAARLSRWVAMAEAGLADQALREMPYDAHGMHAEAYGADWHATHALLSERAGRVEDAIAAYRRALARPAAPAVHRFWDAELTRLTSHS
jgi:predicted RNA polymerase sigma factor